MEVRRHVSWKNLKSYKALVKESLTTDNRAQLIKSAKHLRMK